MGCLPNRFELAMTVAATYHFDRALLGAVPSRRVRVAVDAQGRIAQVTSNAPPHASDRRYAVGLAGIPNAHSHAHQAAIAGRTEQRGDRDDTFWTWRAAMYRYALRMTPEQFLAVATALYVAMLKGGFTAVGEFHYLHHDVDGAPYAERALLARCVLTAAERAGLSVTLLPVLYRFADFGDVAAGRDQRRFVNDIDGYLRIVDDAARAARDTPNARVGLAPHSLRAVNADALRAILARSPLADDAPVHVHIAEQQSEVDTALAALGRRPVAYLLEQFDVNERWCLVHATHTSDDEIDALARSRAVVALCPSTEANLGDGLFDAARFVQRGGHIAVGSDSNLITDAADELRWLEYGQRLRLRQRNVLAPRNGSGTGCTLLDLAQGGGAQALGQPAGELTPGRRADFITLATDTFELAGRDDDVFDAYVFSAGRRAVQDVYIAGRRVIADGHHPEEDAINSAARRALKELTP